MINNIKHISYDYEKQVMYIELKQPQLHKNYMKKIISYKVPESVFVEKCEKWIKNIKEK